MTPGTCIHFTGFGFGRDDSGCCAAGAHYEREFGAEPGVAKRAPCIDYMLKSPRGGTVLRPGEIGIRSAWRPAGTYPMPCSRRVEPTDEQVLADQFETQAAIDRHVTALQVVGEWRTWSKTNRVGKQGVIECPICKGRLHLSQAAHNGHVHGKCETAGCLSWME